MIAATAEAIVIAYDQRIILRKTPDKYSCNPINNRNICGRPLPRHRPVGRIRVQRASIIGGLPIAGSTQVCCRQIYRQILLSLPLVRPLLDPPGVEFDHLVMAITVAIGVSNDN
jgi:hypothetical protein